MWGVGCCGQGQGGAGLVEFTAEGGGQVHLLHKPVVLVGIKPLLAPRGSPKHGEHDRVRRVIVGNPSAGGSFACLQRAGQIGRRGVAQVAQHHGERRRGVREACKKA